MLYTRTIKIQFKNLRHFYERTNPRLYLVYSSYSNGYASSCYSNYRHTHLPHYISKIKYKTAEKSNTKILKKLNSYENDTKKEPPTTTNHFTPNISIIKNTVPLKSLLTVPILHINVGSQYGSVDNKRLSYNLSPFIFGKEPLRLDILHKCVIYQRNKKRGHRNAGAITKNISSISGSGKKVRMQKGTGMARAGHKRPPHWRGGAKAHGPKGKNQVYETKLNKKVKKLGLRVALSQKLREGNLLIVDNFDELRSLKTKMLFRILNSIGISRKNNTGAYIVDNTKHLKSNKGEDIYNIGGINLNLKLSSQNIHSVKVVNQNSINVYDILKHEKLVLSLSAIHALENRLL